MKYYVQVGLVAVNVVGNPAGQPGQDGFSLDEVTTFYSQFEMSHLLVHDAEFFMDAFLCYGVMTTLGEGLMMIQHIPAPL